MVRHCCKWSEFGNCFQTGFPFLSNLLTIAERILNNLLTNSTNHHVEHIKNFLGPQTFISDSSRKPGSTWTSERASRNDASWSFSVSLQVYTSISLVFLYFQYWVVTAVLSESPGDSSWSLDGVGVVWWSSGSDSGSKDERGCCLFTFFTWPLFFSPIVLLLVAIIFAGLSFTRLFETAFENKLIGIF